MTEAIEVAHLSKVFRLATERRDSLKERFVRGRGRHEEFWALRDVTFDVERGTTFGLLGHNGSGKSTLLKILCGIYRPTTGAVTARGRVSSLLELGAGFHGELSGRENVYLNGSILGLSRKQIDAAMERIIDFAGIEEFIDSPVKIYSSGMYVRLGFSIAVTVEPEILMVDEIIAVGDEEFQRKCFDHLFELRRRGTTIVIVSHALGILADLCDQAIWLDHGRARSLGDVRDVVDDYLREVNRKEAEASGADGGHDLGSGPARLGSGDVRITGVDYLDDSGADTPFLSAGEPCTIRLHYKASSYIPDAVFGLGFVHESGVSVAGPNSGEHSFPVEAGSGFVDYRLPRLALQPGSYLISTAVVSKGHTYDYVDRGFELRVRADRSLTEPGLTLFFGSWSIERTSESVPASQEIRS
ncbi:MAG: ABC transporter ATP-binding protein [Nocardioidaceae bacterium]